MHCLERKSKQSVNAGHLLLLLNCPKAIATKIPNITYLTHSLICTFMEHFPACPTDKCKRQSLTSESTQAGSGPKKYMGHYDVNSYFLRQRSLGAGGSSGQVPDQVTGKTLLGDSPS